MLGTMPQNYGGRRWCEICCSTRRDGAVVCDDGLRIEDLYQYKMENGKIEGFPESKFLVRERRFLSMIAIF